ncbi:hypothetical protein HDIA_0802 [Hartmannibacter diazotrophicus]|uniref:Uncharacterized protein n=1 Tax=Hartmannibacter diazotrophicus TaxID=1482074 RepID=A0A2C9D296_9HYPH|nr:hypothetical protein [Hartmannibacter diazotrophicus]SON54343.1 hypothetical protein HDIA_0802 [Hartmannibacter diazotrophicus]
MKKVRNNDYYLKVMERNHPAVYADYRAGKYASVREARQAAGLLSSRTRLHELKNAWSKSTLAERKAFLNWVRTNSQPAVGKATRGSSTKPTPMVQVVDKEGRLLPNARARILKEIADQGLTQSQLADAIGISRLDISVQNALKRDQRLLNAETVKKLRAWHSRL